MAGVLSTLALKGILEKHRADLERAGPLAMTFDATQAILPRLERGERADLLILTHEAIEALREQGRVKESWVLGSSGVGVAVRAGAPKPDIGTLDAFKAALLAAQSVAHSKVGASGIYFAGLLERLELAAKLKKRVVVERGPVGEVVARGEAELGVQQLCELAPVAGIDIVGLFPDAVQTLTWFAAGIPADADDPGRAKALVEQLLSEKYRAAMVAGGIQPA